MSIFSKVQLTRPKRSTFNYNHTSLLTTQAGWLVPIYWNYFEPYSNMKVSTEMMTKTLAMIAPIYNRVNIYTYWFKWPIRLGMDRKDLENFITGGVDGLGQVTYPKYKISRNSSRAVALLSNVLCDYLDLPGLTEWLENGEQNEYYELDAMPLWCYYEVWKNFFADNNLSFSYDIEDYRFTGELVLDDYTDDDVFNMHADLFSIKARCWEKDYFTSALKEPQRGTDVHVPFTVLSELAMDGTDPSKVHANTVTLQGETNSLVGDFEVTPIITDRSNGIVKEDTQLAPVQIDVTPHTKVVSQVLGTINDFRQSNRLQRWFERNAVGGARYIEAINAHYGVWADDYRLQRPEYLGGSRTPLGITEILQTSATEKPSPQGEMAGRGFTMDRNGYIHAKMKEFCIVMGFTAIVPKSGYFQGMPRKWNIRDRYDFPWPEFGHLGEQEVYKDELYYAGGKPHQDTHLNSSSEEVSNVFGYQSRYAQFKYEPNRVHTDFRSTLGFWHLARKFEDYPKLNRDFVDIRYPSDGDDLNRIFAVTDGSPYDSAMPWLMQFGFNMRVKRPLPYYGTPTL